MGKRKVTQYTLEFKKSSAKLASESGQSISQTARGLGVNETTLHGWVKQYYPRPSKSESTKNEADLHKETKRLTKELNRLKLEKEILKKAAAYFAQDTM